MRVFSSWLTLLLASVFLSAAPAAEPVRIIFDTDIGNDVDDAMALSMMHALADRGECRILAITITKDNPYAAPMVDLMNVFHGRPDIPIGCVRNGPTRDDGKYLKTVVTAQANGQPLWPRRLQKSSDAPEAVRLLRQVLAKEPDQSVVIVQVGFSTNLARLLESPGDDESPLSGSELARRKVKFVSLMAGGFGRSANHKEYNIVEDLPSARILIAKWPTPLVFSGFEVGESIQQRGPNLRADLAWSPGHPLARAYELYRGFEHNQPTWDLTSLLYAVRPNRGYFDLSPPGRVTLEKDGRTRFQVEEKGPHRYLLTNQEQLIRVRETQELLCTQPPRHTRTKATP